MPNQSKGIAVIAGASTGTGAVDADRLAHWGYNLLLTARDQARMDALAETLHAETKITVLVNNAGIWKWATRSMPPWSVLTGVRS